MVPVGLDRALFAQLVVGNVWLSQVLQSLQRGNVSVCLCLKSNQYAN